MAKRGQHGWMPKYLIDEAEQIMKEDGLTKRSHAFENVVKYSQIGREVNRLRQLGYDWKKKETPIRIHNRNKKHRWIEL